MSAARALALRALRRVAPSLALALVFVLAGIAGGVGHLDTKAGRRLVARATNALVSQALVAGLQIEHIEVLSPMRLAVSRATLNDRLGKPLLVAEGMDVRFGLVQLLRGIFADDAVRVALSDVRAARLAVFLRRDPTHGGLTFETAFDTRTPKRPGAVSKPVFVTLSRVVVGAATVATDLPGIEQVSAVVKGLEAALAVSPSGLVIPLKSADVRIARLFAEPVQGRLDSELRFPGTTRATLEARVGDAPVVARVRWRGSELELGLDSNELHPAAMQRLFGSWPLVVPLRASAEGTGPATALAVHADGSTGQSRVSVTGSLALTPEIASELDAHATALDLRVFGAGLPETALEVNAKLRLRLTAEGLKLEFDATLPASRLGGYTLPPVAVRGSYAQRKLTGTVKVLDPGLASEGSFEVSPEGTFAFTTSSRAVELGALAGYGVTAKGHGTLRSKGVLEQGRLRASFDAKLTAPHAGPVSAETATITGQLEGPVSDLGQSTLALVLESEGFDAAGMRFEHVRARSAGTLRKQSLSVEGASAPGVELEASAELLLGAAPTLEHVHVDSRRADATVAVTAERVTFAPGSVLFDGFELRAGDGSIAGSIAVHAGRRIVDLVITDLDVRRALSALGLGPHGMHGRLAGHVNLEELGTERTGAAVIELHDGALPPVEELTVKLRAKFVHEEIAATADFTVGGIGSGKLEANGRLRRSLLDPEAARALQGDATLAFDDWDLEQASRRWLAATGIELGGRAIGKLHVARAAPESALTLGYELQTHDLVIERPAEADHPRSEIRVDIDSAGDLFAAQGSHIVLKLVDAQGPWILADLQHSLGPAAFGKAMSGELSNALLDAPLRARVVAYRRPLRMLDLTGTSALESSIAAAMNVTGSVRGPELDASVTVTGARAQSPAKAPDVLEVALRYSAPREEYSLEAATTGGVDRVTLHAAGHFGWLERGLGQGFTARGEAKVAELGLARFGRVLDVPLEGQASGQCVFDLAAPKLEADAELELTGLRVGGRPVGDGKGKLHVANDRGVAKVEIVQGASTLEVLGDAGLAWKAGVPALDTASTGMLRATAHDFELEAVGALARGVATRVSGRLNGRAEVNWGTSGSARRPTILRANATVHDGTASLTAGGGLIQGVEAHALADGDGPLRLTFSGAARSRKPNVRGTADLAFEGPSFKRLDAKFQLDGFPLLHDGILLGRATTPARAAKLELSIVAVDRGQTIDVSIPAVEVKLPEANDKSLIALDDDASIAIAEVRTDPEEQRRVARDASQTTLTVRFGKQVVVKRDALEVPVSGTLSMAPDGRLTGSVILRAGGVVPGLGQIFRITRGVVTFKNQEVKDGTLAIEASTRAVDGTLVELAISGSVREPVISFHSDPPRSEAEIVALLLGIQTDTTSGSNSQQLGTKNQQLGRTAMAMAMNRLLEGSALSGLQFGAGETVQGEAVSTVSVRVGSKVWLEGRSVKGSDTSVNPSERVSGVVDWRFAPTWSLRSQLGDISGVELRWSLRY